MTLGRPTLPAAVLGFEEWLLGQRHRTSKILVVSFFLLFLIVDYSRFTLESFSPGLLECLRAPTQYAGVEVALLYVPVINGPQPDAGPQLLRTSLGFHPLRGQVPRVAEGTAVSVRGRCTALGEIEVAELWTHPLRPVKEKVSSATVLLLLLGLAGQYLGGAGLIRWGRGVWRRRV